MERTISQEERIRRAEEIYQRRNKNREGYFKSESVPAYKKAKKSMTKKLITQSFVCIVIYFTIYFAKGTGGENFEQIINRIKENITNDINIEMIKNKAEDVKGWFENIVNEKQEEYVENTENIENAENVDSTDEKIIENQEVQNIEPVENIAVENKSQEEIDIEYVKNNKSIIWPLNGVITSGFGTREATEIVTANHYGIDIAGNIGDTILSAMSGVVTLVSSEGDYGKHIKIEDGEVTTLYAHCSTLLVTEGQEINQGEKIAEVGQTGRATRATFAF